MERHEASAIGTSVSEGDALPLPQRLLLASLSTPWLPPTSLAEIIHTAPNEARQYTQSFLERGLLQPATQALSNYPSVLVALTEDGLHATAQLVGLSTEMLLRRWHFTPGRYWAMRAALEYVHELRALCDATALDISSGRRFIRFDYSLFLAYRYKSTEIHLHGNIALSTLTQEYPYFLLLDRGDAPVWQWYPQLRCLNRMARSARVPSYFPPLLIISTRDFRASAMLALARMASPTLTVAATALRDVALDRGLLAVTHEQGWRSIKLSGALATVDPFRLLGLEQSVFRRCHFSARPPDHVRLPKPATQSASAAPTHTYLKRPTQLDGLEQLEALTDTPYRLLTFLVRHPVMPISALATFLTASVDDVERDLTILQQHGLAERIAAPRKLDEPIWAATNMALRLRMAREMQPPGALKRYRFYRRDAERYLFHTLAVHRFFESIKKRCDGRSRATRQLDTPPGALNTGCIPYYELAVYESEVMACDRYIHNQQARHWRPDGYGALRAGTTYTRFWLEMDGTSQAPSRKDPAVWQGKMDRLCDYILSRRWALRYPHVPRLLVVTTDVSNCSFLFDALVAATQARTILKRPEVYLTCTAALQQRGPLGRIWHHVSHLDETSHEHDVLCYAFDGVAPLAVQPQQSFDIRTMDR